MSLTTIVQEIDFKTQHLLHMPLQRRSLEAARWALSQPHVAHTMEKCLAKTFSIGENVVACMGYIGGDVQECWAFVASDMMNHDAHYRAQIVRMAKNHLDLLVKNGNEVRARVDGTSSLDVDFLTTLGFVEEGRWFVLCG